MSLNRQLANLAGQSLATDAEVADATGAVRTGFKNYVINGGFDVWQRGTSQSVGGYGSADRWNMNFSGAAGTASRQEFTVGQTDVPGEPRYFLRFQTTVADDNSGPIQFIEDVRTLAGETVTVSFWAKAAASTTFRAQLQQLFGSGGSSTVSADSVPVTLTTSWQRYSGTVTLPSIAGKTIGANSSLRIILNKAESETFTVDLYGVQVEKGDTATEFERLPFGVELARCQRYYWRTEGGGYTTHAVGQVRTANNANMRIFLPTQMRTTSPSVTFNNLGIHVPGYYIKPVTGISVNTVTATVLTLDAAASSGGMTGKDSAELSSNNGSGYLSLDAEL